MLIAIDGPAGSGKSTTARAVARRLGFYYLDTGAMYRTVALAFLRQGMAPSEKSASVVLQTLALELRTGPDGLRLLLAGQDVSEEIRGAEVTAMSSEVGKLPSVRQRMVEEQRRLAGVEVGRGRGVVLEGRDIGTVVFPNADLKVFLTADLKVRAARRAQQMGEKPGDVGEAAIQREMEARDEQDSTRAASPLRRAPDAVLIDTSRTTFQEQVTQIVTLAGERRKASRVGD